MTLQRFTNSKTSWWALSGNDFDLMLSMSLSNNESSIDLFDTLCESDIATFIDPFLELTGDEPFYSFSVQFYPFFSVAASATCYEMEHDDRPPIDIDWEQLNKTPEVLKFQLTQKQWQCRVPQQAYEIGRFITKNSHVGVIKSIETEIIFSDNDIRWPRGDSSWFERQFSVAPEIGEVFVSWALKIESIQGVQADPNDFRLLPIVNPAEWFHEIPGTVHPDITPWNRMLFLWGADHPVHFLCPPDSLVSLWCYREPDAGGDNLWAMGGMMKGFTQIMDSDRTYENLTRAY